MRELTVEAGIGYGVAWRTVHKLLIEASLETSGILAAPAPMLTQMALRDFAVNSELRARTLDAVNMVPIGSQLRANVLDSFNAAGVEIMTPNVQAVRDTSGMAIPPERTNAGNGSGHPLRIVMDERAAGV